MAEKESKVFVNGIINSNTGEHYPCLRITKVLDVDTVSRSFELIFKMRDLLG